MLDLVDLLQGRASYLLLLVGILSVWVSTIRVEDLGKLKIEPREKVSKALLVFGIATLGLSAAFYLIPERLTPYPDVAGRWSYEVRNGLGEFSHKGDCVIRQDGPNLAIQGTRRWTCRRVNGQYMCVRVNAPWSSKWAQVCGDGRVRFDYVIGLAEEHVTGYCSLERQDKSGKVMNGFYYMLPPFRPETLNARHGEIVFRRLPDGKQVEPPSEEDIASIGKSQSSSKADQ